MRTFSVIYGKEIKSFFISPVAYLVLFGCSLFIGFGFDTIIGIMMRNGIKNVTVIQVEMNEFFFWVPLFVQIPFITMRTFSEEYKLGTIEMLLSAPVREWEVVLGKFGAVLTFYAVLWSPILVNLSFLYLFTNQPFDGNWMLIVLPMVMTLLIGSFYISVGLFTSVMTKNQIVAAILCFVFIFLLFSLDFLPALGPSSDSRDFISYVSAREHMDVFSRGLFDTRPLVFYISGTAFFLFLTQRILESRRLKA